MMTRRGWGSAHVITRIRVLSAGGCAAQPRRYFGLSDHNREPGPADSGEQQHRAGKPIFLKTRDSGRRQGWVERHRKLQHIADGFDPLLGLSI